MALSPMKRKANRVKRKQAEWEKQNKSKRTTVYGVPFEYMSKQEMERIDKATRGWTSGHLEWAGMLNSGRIITPAEVPVKGEPVVRGKYFAEFIPAYGMWGVFHTDDDDRCYELFWTEEEAIANAQERNKQ